MGMSTRIRMLSVIDHRSLAHRPGPISSHSSYNSLCGHTSLPQYVSLRIISVHCPIKTAAGNHVGPILRFLNASKLAFSKARDQFTERLACSSKIAHPESLPSKQAALSHLHRHIHPPTGAPFAASASRRNTPIYFGLYPPFLH